MAYTRIKLGTDRAESYRFTIDTLLDKELESLRKEIKKYNRAGLTPRRIRIRPRGSRLYFANGRVRRNIYDTPKENATRYDVYVNLR